MPTHGNEVLDRMLASWKSQEPLKIEMADHLYEEWGTFIRKHGWKYPKQEKPAESFQSNIFPFAHGLIEIATYDELEAKDFQIAMRFTAVFEQAYTRFLDLQRAEAQAREAQIEAALERVRSSIQGMRSSDDLIDIVNVLRHEMRLLEQPELESFIIHLYQDNAPEFEAWWAFLSPDDDSGKVINGYVKIPVDICEYIVETIENYYSEKSEFLIESSGRKLKDWYKALETIAPATLEYDDHGQIIVPDVLYYHHVKFSGGALLMVSIIILLARPGNCNVVPPLFLILRIDGFLILKGQKNRHVRRRSRRLWSVFAPRLWRCSLLKILSK